MNKVFVSMAAIAGLLSLSALDAMAANDPTRQVRPSQVNETKGETYTLTRQIRPTVSSGINVVVLEPTGQSDGFGRMSVDRSTALADSILNACSAGSTCRMNVAITNGTLAHVYSARPVGAGSSSDMTAMRTGGSMGSDMLDGRVRRSTVDGVDMLMIDPVGTWNRSGDVRMRADSPMAKEILDMCPDGSKCMFEVTTKDGVLTVSSVERVRGDASAMQMNAGTSMSPSYMTTSSADTSATWAGSRQMSVNLRRSDGMLIVEPAGSSRFTPLQVSANSEIAQEILRQCAVGARCMLSATLNSDGTIDQVYSANKPVVRQASRGRSWSSEYQKDNTLKMPQIENASWYQNLGPDQLP